jgi:hypothetical protein
MQVAGRKEGRLPKSSTRPSDVPRKDAVLLTSMLAWTQSTPTLTLYGEPNGHGSILTWFCDFCVRRSTFNEREHGVRYVDGKGLSHHLPSHGEHMHADLRRLEIWRHDLGKGPKGQISTRGLRRKTCHHKLNVSRGRTSASVRQTFFGRPTAEELHSSAAGHPKKMCRTGKNPFSMLENVC